MQNVTSNRLQSATLKAPTMTPAALETYNIHASAATYLPTDDPIFDSLMVRISAMDTSLTLTASEQNQLDQAAQTWLDIKRAIKDAHADGGELASVIAQFAVNTITERTDLITMGGVVALCTRFMDSLPDPVLTEHTQALVNRTNTAANQAITEARKHGAPAHWNGQSALNTYRDCKGLWSARRTASIPRQIVQAIASLLAEAVPVIHARMVATKGQQEADELVKGLLHQISTLANHHLYPLIDAADQSPLDSNEIARKALEMFRMVFSLVGTMSRAFAPGANHMVSIQMKGL